MPTYHFPRNFLWGTATAAHQTEGNNTNSDWWRWEQSKDYVKNDRKYPLEPSGIACDSYNRYEEDLDLCVKMNNNAVRFSVEWARLEPKEGEFDEKEFEHYKKVIKAAKARGLKTFVTLHHFVNPIWFTDKGGWMNWSCPNYFERYAKKCAEEFGDSVDVYTTLNEPHGYSLMMHVSRRWFYQKSNLLKGLLLCQINFMRAHNRAYDAIKSVNKNHKVGVVHQAIWCIGIGGRIDRIVARIVNYYFIEFFLGHVRKHLDYIGLNFYLTVNIKGVKVANPHTRNNDLGWWINETGLEECLLRVKKYGLPIYVTESGVADAKDELRADFIKDMLHACANAIDKGVDLRGYFYWSLIDNYEWFEGYRARFGLIEIDRENGLARKPRKSSEYYSKICKGNKVEF